MRLSYCMVQSMDKKSFYWSWDCSMWTAFKFSKSVAPISWWIAIQVILLVKYLYWIWKKFRPILEFCRLTSYRCVEKVPKNVLGKCDPCVDDPCKNGGTCQKMKGWTFSCKCAASYHGKYCESKIDVCYGEPCLNNATCKVILLLSLYNFFLPSVIAILRRAISFARLSEWRFML